MRPALLLQTLMVRELFMLARVAQQECKLPGFRAQQWYFFWAAAFWLYLRYMPPQGGGQRGGSGGRGQLSTLGCLSLGGWVGGWGGAR